MCGGRVSAAPVPGGSNRISAVGSDAYAYDAVSNRLTKVNGGTTTTTVPGGSNKISAVGSDAYAYDAAGNVTDDGAREYVWNAAGLLKEVKISSTVVGAYTYNASNQRTKKVSGGNTVHYVYGIGGLLYGEYDNTGALIREYVHLNGEPLAQIDAGSPEVLTYLHTDHLMTPRYGTNVGGSTVWAWDSDAFGNGAPTGAATVNLRFPGQYHDSEAGLFYNWNRTYNPAIGRYISSDPIGLAGGLNTFGYAGQSPVMFGDPNGERKWIGFLTLGEPTLTLGPTVCYLSRCSKQGSFDSVALAGLGISSSVAIPDAKDAMPGGSVRLDIVVEDYEPDTSSKTGVLFGGIYHVNANNLSRSHIHTSRVVSADKPAGVASVWGEGYLIVQGPHTRADIDERVAPTCKADPVKRPAQPTLPVPKKPSRPRIDLKPTI